MGWLYGWNSKKELVDHLTKPFETGGGMTKTLARTVKGNHLWMVMQHPGRPPFIALALLGYGKRDGWGYKDMDESMGPNETDVPLKFLDMAPPNDPYGWREKVRAHYAHASAKSALVKRLAPGVRVKFIDRLTVQGVPITAGTIRSVSPLVVIPDEHPYPAKLKKTHIAEVLPSMASVTGGKRRHAGVGALATELKALLK